MGELSEDLERCLCECSCDEAAAARARCSCEEGRVRETKRVLLGERPHAAQGELRMRDPGCARAGWGGRAAGRRRRRGGCG